jgi:hypothetical protein
MVSCRFSDFPVNQSSDISANAPVDQWGSTWDNHLEIPGFPPKKVVWYYGQTNTKSGSKP